MPKKPPQKTAHSLGREINLAARGMRALLDARLHQSGTSFATWTVLFTLDSEGPVIQRQLAQRLEVEGATLVRRLDLLEAEGLVLRTDSATDRRASQVALTEKGRALFKQIRGAVSETEGKVLSDLDPRDIEITRKVLRSLIDTCRRLVKGT